MLLSSGILNEGANIITSFNNINIGVSFGIFFYIAIVTELTRKSMKLKYDLEYNLNCSVKVLFSRLSTPEGLSEWFADNVNVDGDIYTFFWARSQARAKLSSVKENKYVRYSWLNDKNLETSFFEFKLNVQDLTGDVALIITDFAEEDEKDDAIDLWNSQISELKHALGI